MIGEAFCETYGSQAGPIVARSIRRLRSLKESVEHRLKKGAGGRFAEIIGRQLDEVKFEEARLIKNLIQRFGEPARREAARASYAFGKKVGLELSEEQGFVLEDREEAKRFLHFWFHDFIPCGACEYPCLRSCSKALIRHEECPHEAYWKKARISPEVMCEIQGNFVKGLLETTSVHTLKVKARRTSERKGTCELYELS